VSHGLQEQPVEQLATAEAAGLEAAQQQQQQQLATADAAGLEAAQQQQAAAAGPRI
jgi:hypothetical protein